MKIIICGAGQVGQHTAEVLGEGGHDITVVDHSAPSLRRFEESVDVGSIVGSACHAQVLRDAGVENCDLLVAATDQDEINLLASTIAKRMGATKTIARIHHRAFLEKTVLDYSKYMDIDHLICPEYLTALLIARNLRNPGAMALETFANGQIEMHTFLIQADSELANRPLSEARLPHGVRLAAIERHNEISVPRGDSILQAEDVVTVIGDTSHSNTVRKIFQITKRRESKVAIMGGSSMAVWLSRALNSPMFSIRLFETEHERAQELSTKLAHITVIEADPTDPTVFREERLEECDVFVAVSGSDEHNILGALQAKELGCQTNCVVVSQPTYIRLLEHVNIDYPYSPRIVAAREVHRLVDESPVKTLATLAAGLIDVYELVPTGSGSAVGRPLKETKLPEGAFVAALQRQSSVHVPGAEDSVREGDVLVVIGPVGIQKKLKALFIG